MEKQVAQKLAEILKSAADAYAKRSSGFLSYSQSVGKSFWEVSDKDGQTWVMQEVYLMLCSMDMTPLESDR